MALKRSTVTPSFTLRLTAPDTPAYGYDEQLLEVAVPDPTTPVTPSTPPAEPCLRRDDAALCLDNRPEVGLTGILASGLMPGSELTITNDLDLIVYQGPNSGVENQSFVGQPGRLIQIIGSPPPGQTLRLHISGTTAAGNPLEGFVAVTTTG